MQKPLVYVETSIPSFYHELRTTPDVVARREWTRQWWTEAPDRYELTWNCAHVANANKFGHIRRINTMLGLYVPALVTPLEFLGADHESNEA